jgi:uncharacterized membrane protein
LRHTIKALRLITAVLWIAVLILPVTVAFSLLKIFEIKNNVGIGEPSFNLSDESFSISIPFYMNNTGFYDLSELYAYIKVYDGSKVIAESSTNRLDVPAGETIASNLSILISLEDIFSEDRELLTSDKELNVSTSLHFRVAYALAFTVTTSSIVQWGAPFSNLTIRHIDRNETHQVFSVSFFNNASFPLSGPLRLELLNLSNITVGSMEQQINVPSKGLYRGLFEISVPELTDGGTIRLYFADMLFREERWESL